MLLLSHAATLDGKPLRIIGGLHDGDDDHDDDSGDGTDDDDTDDDDADREGDGGSDDVEDQMHDDGSDDDDDVHAIHDSLATAVQYVFFVFDYMCAGICARDLRVGPRSAIATCRFRNTAFIHEHRHSL